MKNILTSLFSFFCKANNQQKCFSGLSAQKTASRKVGPFGEYAWGQYDLDEPSIDGGNAFRFEYARERRFACLTARTPEDEREYFYCGLLSLTTAPMVIRGLISIKSEILSWLEDQGEEYCRETFNCWPFILPCQNSLLISLSPKEVLLYEYLANLSRKKNFSVENSPKIISRHFEGEELGLIYSSLCKKDLLIELTLGIYKHNDNSKSKEIRYLMREFSGISTFMETIERFTSRMTEDLQQAKTKDHLVILAPELDDDYYCPCPICNNLPFDGRKLELSDELIKPFHYNCGIKSTMLAPADFEYD